jgi:hypothetical protein
MAASGSPVEIVGSSVDDDLHARSPPMTTRRVVWRRSDEIEADEHCTLTLRDGSLSLVGTVIGAEGGLPVRTEYRVLADRSGMTAAVHVRDLRGFETRTITVERIDPYSGTSRLEAKKLAPIFIQFVESGEP